MNLKPEHSRIRENHLSRVTNSLSSAVRGPVWTSIFRERNRLAQFVDGVGGPVLEQLKESFSKSGEIGNLDLRPVARVILPFARPGPALSVRVRSQISLELVDPVVITLDDAVRGYLTFKSRLRADVQI